MTRFHLFFTALSLAVLVWASQPGADTRQLADVSGETVWNAPVGAVADAERKGGEPRGSAPMCHDCTLSFATASGALAGVALPHGSAQPVRWAVLVAADTQHRTGACFARGPPSASYAYPTL